MAAEAKSSIVASAEAVSGGTVAAKAPPQYIELITSAGTIQIKLHWEAAPKTCELISKLVAGGYYNGCSFYRAEPGFVLQGGLRPADGGAPKTNPFGKVPLEHSIKNTRGTVTMARWEDTSSGNGEFFINLGTATHLDRYGDGTGWAAGFAVWGQVVSGMDIVDSFSTQATTVKGGLKMLDTLIKFDAKAIVV